MIEQNASNPFPVILFKTAMFVFLHHLTSIVNVTSLLIVITLIVMHDFITALVSLLPIKIGPAACCLKNYHHTGNT